MSNEYVPYRTYQEYLNHPTFKSIRSKAFKQQNGLCELCGDIGIDIHHKKYPKWGTFETDTTGLQVLCRSCHCKVHTKEK